MADELVALERTHAASEQHDVGVISQVLVKCARDLLGCAHSVDDDAHPALPGLHVPMGALDRLGDERIVARLARCLHVYQLSKLRLLQALVKNRVVERLLALRTRKDRVLGNVARRRGRQRDECERCCERRLGPGRAAILLDRVERLQERNRAVSLIEDDEAVVCREPGKDWRGERSVAVATKQQA